MNYYILYKTTNTTNGKFYIGKHKCKSLDFDGYLGSGNVIKAAIAKYGEGAFVRETLAVFGSNAAVTDIEQRYVTADFIFANKSTCYNKATGGHGGFVVDDNGVEVNIASTPLVREKLRLIGLDVHNRPDVKHRKSVSQLGSKNHRYGTKKTDEEKKRLSASLIGRVTSEATRKKLSISLTGRHVPEYVGAKISAALKGRKVPEEQIVKMREARVGKTHPESVKDKIRNSHIGMTYPEVTCNHCGLSGRGGNMTRYHFDNCKSRNPVDK